MNSVITKPMLTNKESFVKMVSREILSGKWKPGDKLPSERDYAAVTGFGKTVVHSGFEQLAAMGLVDIKPKSGIYVADHMKTGNIETLNAIVHLNGFELGRELIEAILDFRLAIEGMALRSICISGTKEDIEYLRCLTKDLLDNSQSMGEEELAQAFFLWHREICIRSGKSVLTLFMNTVHDVAIPFWINYLRLYGVSFAIERLEQFIDLIEARDGEGAYDLLASGINDYLARLGQ